MFCAILDLLRGIACNMGLFTRQSHLPFRPLFLDLPHLSGVPVNALLLLTTIQVFLGLIYLGSSTAFNAFVGVAVVCLGTSYALPVAISLAWAAGRFQMHHWGWAGQGWS